MRRQSTRRAFGEACRGARPSGRRAAAAPAAAAARLRAPPPPPPRRGTGAHRLGAAPPPARRRGAAPPAASASAPERPYTPRTGTEVLPIFPLGMVALPAADVPLQIFEARYRVLFSTLLAGAEGIEEGLVSPDKPWLGSRRFGMSFFDSAQGALASVGCALEIVEHSRVDDGRLLVGSRGRERFRIVRVVEEKPVLLCEVEYMAEKDDGGEVCRALAAEVGRLFRDVVRLSVKLRGAPLPPEAAAPPQLEALPPGELSFWVASMLANAPHQQQALLEIDETAARLTAVRDLLGGTLKLLTAQTALAGAFKGGDGDGEAPPPGGPD